MNYLGHLLLSGTHEYILVGNFLADRLNYKQSQELTKVYQPGILLHRYIDNQTDTHPYFKDALQILYPEYGKYASVILDIVMDYLLSQHWSSFTDESYLDFKTRIYRILTKHLADMPISTQTSVSSMIQHDWLNAYTSWEGLTDVFTRLDQRARFASQFANKVPYLQTHIEVLSDQYEEFFRAIQQGCRNFIEIYLSS